MATSINTHAKLRIFPLAEHQLFCCPSSYPLEPNILHPSTSPNLRWSDTSKIPSSNYQLSPPQSCRPFFVVSSSHKNSNIISFQAMECAAEGCREPGTFPCLMCNAAQPFPGDPKIALYCSSDHRKGDQARHQGIPEARRLEGRAMLHRVMETAKKLFFIYRELTFAEFEIEIVENLKCKDQGDLVLHGQVLSTTSRVLWEILTGDQLRFCPSLGPKVTNNFQRRCLRESTIGKLF